MCRVTKGVDEKIDKGVLKCTNLRECTGSHSLGRKSKRWIDTIKDCLKNVRQAKRMVHDGKGL